MYKNSKYPDCARYVDVEAGLCRVIGNKKLYGKMLRMFRGSGEFAKLERAIEAGDAAAAAETAHAIKGMAGNLSLNRVFHTSEALLKKLRAGEIDPMAVLEYRESLARTFEILEDLSAYMDGWPEG